MKTNIGIVSQARLGSTRLPAKVLRKINNKTLLDYHFERLEQSGYQVYLTTTNLPQDDVLEEYSIRNQIPFVRGSEQDVLSRFTDVILKYNLEHVVRVTSDCPLIDGELIANAIEMYFDLLKDSNKVFLSNTLDRTYPRGFDFEIFSAALLLESNKKAKLKEEREHVTPYIWKGKIPNTQLVQYKNNSYKNKYRLTVDTNEDLELITTLIKKYNCDTLGVNKIIAVMDENPVLHSINKHIEQKKIEE